MPFEGRQRAAALDRCWSIYLSLTRAFILPEEFHAELPVAVESVLISATLQFTVPIGLDLTLSLREEYVFDRQRLKGIASIPSAATSTNLSPAPKRSSHRGNRT
jgi:hypothetical protein